MYPHLKQRIQQAAAPALAMVTLLTCVQAAAKLPPPTPQQQEAAAAKKAQAAAQSEKEKQELTASMDKLAARWRAKAAANGWKTHSPVAVAPAGSSGTAPAGAPGATTTPVRSEKLGTAAPSEDVKNPAKKGPPDQIK